MFDYSQYGFGMAYIMAKFMFTDPSFASWPCFFSAISSDLIGCSHTGCFSNSHILCHWGISHHVYIGITYTGCSNRRRRYGRIWDIRLLDRSCMSSMHHMSLLQRSQSPKNNLQEEINNLETLSYKICP